MRVWLPKCRCCLLLDVFHHLLRILNTYVFLQISCSSSLKYPRSWLLSCCRSRLHIPQWPWPIAQKMGLYASPPHKVLYWLQMLRKDTKWLRCTDLRKRRSTTTSRIWRLPTRTCRAWEGWGLAMKVSIVRASIPGTAVRQTMLCVLQVLLLLYCWIHSGHNFIRIALD